MKTSQANKIIQYLIENPSGLTQLQAYKEIGCTRLTARIHDLRDRGYKILTDTVKVPTRDGFTYVARYRLDVEEE